MTQTTVQGRKITTYHYTSCRTCLKQYCASTEEEVIALAEACEKQEIPEPICLAGSRLRTQGWPNGGILHVVDKVAIEQSNGRHYWMYHLVPHKAGKLGQGVWITQTMLNNRLQKKQFRFETLVKPTA